MTRLKTALVVVFYVAFAVFSVKVKRDAARAEAFAEFRDGLSNGQSPPPFELADLEGSIHSLEQAMGDGDLVIINFWATWCAPCRLEMPMLESLHERYRIDGLRALAVNVGEDEPTVEAFVRELGVSFPILRDPGHVVATRYRIHALPTTILVSGGQIVDVSEGLDPYLRNRVEHYLQLSQSDPEAF